MDYNRTKSGWFDYQVTKVISLMLPILKRQEGTKVVIGDNLSTRISIKVLRLMKRPALNSWLYFQTRPTLHPLYVALFQVLTNWKKTICGNSSTIPKDEFNWTSETASDCHGIVHKTNFAIRIPQVGHSVSQQATGVIQASASSP